MQKDTDGTEFSLRTEFPHEINTNPTCHMCASLNECNFIQWNSMYFKKLKTRFIYME